jgi:hypothetical protein
MEYFKAHPLDAVTAYHGLLRRPRFFFSKGFMLPPPGQQGITLDRYVFIYPPNTGRANGLTIQTWFHELVHVGQWRFGALSMYRRFDRNEKEARTLEGIFNDWLDSPAGKILILRELRILRGEQGSSATEDDVLKVPFTGWE